MNPKDDFNYLCGIVLFWFGIAMKVGLIFEFNQKLQAFSDIFIYIGIIQLFIYLSNKEKK